MTTKLDYQTVKNLKTAGRYTDALVKGLHVWVKPNGKKYWIFRYTHQSKQHNISLGSFPMLSISNAREGAQSARNDLIKGINPVINKKLAKPTKIECADKVTFEKFALECVEAKRAEWTNDKHAAQWIYTLKNYAFKHIGNKALDEIETDDILNVLQPIWHSKTETASRLRGRLEWILASATTRKLRSGVNPALWRGHLQTILSAPNKLKNEQHHLALSYDLIPMFISKLRGLDSIGALALEFLILNASRTGEVIGAIRDEIKDDVWIIPPNRMKAKKEHRVPLCQRSIEILNIAKAMDEDSVYLFSRNGKPLSNMAMSMILRRLNSEVTVHGFRSTFRDWVSEETDHSPEVAEMALAHVIKNKVEAAYRRKDLLERRRLLMNDWELYCNNKQPSKIIQQVTA